jgi:hypothetical protein
VRLLGKPCQKGHEKRKAFELAGGLESDAALIVFHPHSVLGAIASFYARAELPAFFLVNAHGVGRFIAGVLRRWEEVLGAAAGAEAAAGFDQLARELDGASA